MHFLEGGKGGDVFLFLNLHNFHIQCSIWAEIIDPWSTCQELSIDMLHDRVLTARFKLKISLQNSNFGGKIWNSNLAVKTLSCNKSMESSWCVDHGSIIFAHTGHRMWKLWRSKKWKMSPLPPSSKKCTLWPLLSLFYTPMVFAYMESTYWLKCYKFFKPYGKLKGPQRPHSACYD